MATTNILVICFLIAIIVFNIWNTITLRAIKNKPLRKDQINDAKYWELKYKIQFLVSSFSAIVIIAAFLGYNTIDNIKESVSKEINQKLDSTKRSVVALEAKQNEIGQRIDSTGSTILKYQDIILGLSSKQLNVKESLKLSSADLENLKGKILEINRKNILQQNIYIVDTIQFEIAKLNEDQSKIIRFEELVTINGDRIPTLTTPPFILPISNQGCEYHVSDVTNTSFKLILWSFPGDVKFAKVTLFITARP